jgi:hypothetical protein
MKKNKIMINDKIGLYRRMLFLFTALFFLVFTTALSLQGQTYGNDWYNGNVTADVVLRDVAYGNGVFLASGDQGKMYRSTNGQTWSQVSTGYSGTRYHHFSITFGNGKFVSAGRDRLIITSEDDGLTWTTTNPGSADVYDPDLYGIAYGNNVFVVVGENGDVFTSPDGVTWSMKHLNNAYFRSLDFGQGKFIAGTSGTKIYTSTNGDSWSTIDVGTAVRAIHFGNDLWIGGGVKVITSPNGVNWTTQLNLASYGIVDVIYSAGSAPGTYMLGGEHGLMLTSSDGVAWRKPDLGTKRFIFGIAYGNNVVAAVGNGGPRDPNSLYLYSTHYSPEGGTPPPPLVPSSVNTIKITSPNGGEELEPGTQFQIKWTGSITFDKIDIEYFNGSTWVVIVNDTPDDGVYSWTVPDVSTSQARLWIKGWHSSGNATDYTDGTFTIGEAPEITITAPNGGEILTGGTSYTIRWKGSITFDKVDIEYYNGTKWVVIKNGAADVGTYSWDVPNISTNAARIWIKGWSASGGPVDFSDSTFSIIPPPAGAITVTSPNGGEVWAKGSTENITWSFSGDVGNVRIFYSTDNGFNWTTIVSSTANDGGYPWKLPDILADDCLVKVRDVNNSQISDISNGVFSIGGPPQLVLNKTRFNFGYIKNGASPCVQTLFIYNGGGGTLNWTVGADASWINLNPTSGTGGGTVTIAINTIGLNTGSYMGTITVSDPDVGNSPQTAQVYLTVKNGSQDQVPFGTFATPEDGLANVTGSIAVTGWALDDTCVESVEIYRQVNGGLSFIGDAVFVEGARPDVEQAYPDYPNNSRAGWGYMMLTNFLPDGQLVLKAIATDTTGHQVVLGTKTITVDNANAVKPFGAIDTPGQGGEASGSKFRNNGWALTPQPNKIPENGSTINVFIDAVLVDNVNYNLYRSDIANFFPGYANANGSWGYLDFDTTAYANGVHTIAWAVTDNAGNTDGVGSRYFSIQNIEGVSRSSAQGTAGIATTPGYQGQPGFTPTKGIPGHDFGFIEVKRGYNQERKPQKILPNKTGTAVLEVNELERIEIQLNKNISHGYLVVGNEFRSLPIGSTLVPGKGIFYWQPGAGFLGNYELVFIGKQENGKPFMKRIDLKINPKHFGE